MAKPTNLKSNLPGTRPNYFYSIFGVTLVLVLVGFFGLIMLQANALLKVFRENIQIIAEIKDGVEPAPLDSFQQILRSRGYVLPASVDLTTKEEGAAMLQKDFGEDFMLLDMPNPLFDIVTFNVTSEYHQTQGNLDELVIELKAHPIVRDVYYQKNVADLLAGNIRKLGWAALVLGSFLLVVTIFLIHNTIRLALYSNRFLIKNMELVGASWEFISTPFLKRSFWHGLLSGVLAILILWGLMHLSQIDFPELAGLLELPLQLALFAGILVVGIVITVASTYYVVHKYLKMRVDDLY